MYAATVGVDLAKTRFELAISDAEYRVHRRERLTRACFVQFFANRSPSLIVMEACGSARITGRVRCRRKDMRFGCCRRSTCAPMFGATRPTPPTRRR
jgi:hypothetical protein